MNERQQELLSAYLDGECSLEELGEVGNLLQESAEAQAYLKELRGDLDRLRETLPPTELTPASLERSREAILQALPEPEAAPEASPWEQIRELLAEWLPTEGWLTPEVLALVASPSLALLLLFLVPTSPRTPAPSPGPGTPALGDAAPAPPREPLLLARAPDLRPLGAPPGGTVLTAHAPGDQSAATTIYLEDADVDLIWVLH